MARIDLRNCDVRVKDGLSGTAAVNQAAPSVPKADDTTLTIDTVSLNTAISDKVPIGSRFTLAGETAAGTVHVVTGRTPTDAKRRRTSRFLHRWAQARMPMTLC